jgi:tetratricopeptide (TPR) repeat protein
MKKTSSIITNIVLFTTTIACAATPAYADVKFDQLIWDGYNHLAAGQYDTAVQPLCQAIRLQPGTAEARRYLAIALCQLGYAQESIEQLQAIMSLGQAIPLDFYYCGRAHFISADYPQSIAFYETALKKDPQMELARNGLAEARVALELLQNQSLDVASKPDS